MTRDDLIRQLMTLPADTEVGVRFGDQPLDIAGLTTYAEWGNAFLQCYQGDVDAALRSMHIPEDLRKEIVATIG